MSINIPTIVVEKYTDNATGIWLEVNYYDGTKEHFTTIDFPSGTTDFDAAIFAARLIIMRFNLPLNVMDMQVGMVRDNYVFTIASVYDILKV